MFYREYAPTLLLRPFIKCLWVLEHAYGLGPHQQEWLPANAEVELIFHYGIRYGLIGAGLPDIQPHCFVMGLQERHTVLRSSGFTGLVAVRFHPWGAFPFLMVPVDELANQIIPLDAIKGARTAELE